MPLGLQFPDQIVNVKWGGKAVAVVSVEVADDPSTTGRIYQGKPSSDKDTLQDWKTVVEDGNLAFRCISYALVNGEPTTIGEAIIEVGGTPTFVTGGGWINNVEMRYSTDGETWKTALSNKDYTGGGSGLVGVVWDPHKRAFYAVSSARIDSDKIVGQYQLWQSSDGRSWRMVTELTASSPEEDDAIVLQITSLLLDHCTKPENRGGTESKVPDGFQAYDPYKKIFMTPEALKGWVFPGPTLSLGNTVKIEEEDDDGNKITRSVSFDVEIVWGVSFNGGTWNVLGVRDYSDATFQKPSVVFCSIDDGETWHKVFEKPGWFPAGIVSGDKKTMKK